MTKNASSGDAYARLRHWAESLLKEGNSGNIDTVGQDFFELLHDLEVHQTELDLQNEDLRQIAADREFSRDEYSKLYEFAPVGFLILDKEGAITRINATAVEMLQQANDYMMGQKFSNLIYMEDLSPYFAAIRRVSESGGKSPREILELRLCLKDNDILFARLDLAPKFDLQSQFIGWQFAITDITRSKRAEAALRESEHRYFLIFNTSPNAIMLTKMPEGTTVEVNETFLRLFEYTRDEVIGKTVVEMSIADPDSEARVRAELQQRGSLNDFEVTSRTKSGVQKYLRISSVWVTLGGQKNLLTTIQDVTAYKEAKDALQASEERFRALVQASSDVVFRMIPDWSELRHLVGRNFIADTLEPTRTWLQKYIYPDDQKYVLEVIDRVVRTKSIFELEHRVLRMDGSPGWMFSRAIPILDANGDITEWFGMASDITARKQAEEALRESEERLALAASGTQIGMFEWNIATGKTLWTEQHAKLMGFTTTTTTTTTTTLSLEYTYHDWAGCVHPEDLPLLEEELSRCMAAHAPYDYEYRVVWPDGSVHWLAGRGLFQYDAKDQPVRMLGIIMDITTRKQAEEVLHQAHVQLEQRVQERTADLRASEQSLTRANRALRAISTCNDVLLRSTTEQKLFDEVCRVIVRVGGYRLAWVGLAEHDRKKTVRPVAHDGEADHYLDKPKITWLDSRRGRGPASTAIRTGKPAVLRDLANHPGFAPWGHFARKLGSASALGLPLLAEGKCFGALTILSLGPEAFDPEEIKLLSQLAGDLAFGVTALRTKAARKQLEQQVLEVSEREQRRIGQDLHDSLGQLIAAARFTCSALAQKLAKDNQPAAEDMTQVESTLIQALEETRQIARGLHPVKSSAASLMHALQELADNVTKMFGIPCRFICPKPVPVTDYAAATHLYRIAQEATNNAAHHGCPKQILIRLTAANGGIGLRVEDDGRGMPANTNSNKGLGLAIMQYRASVIGATFAIVPGRNSGTVVNCNWKPPSE